MFDLLKALILAIINVLLAAGPWANFTTFLGSGFVICKIGVVVSCSASVGGPMRLCLGKSLTHSRCSVNCVLSAWRWPLLGKAIYRGSSSLPPASSGISRVCYHVGASDCCNQTPLMWGWGVVLATGSVEAAVVRAGEVCRPVSNYQSGAFQGG